MLVERSEIRILVVRLMSVFHRIAYQRLRHLRIPILVTNTMCYVAYASWDCAIHSEILIYYTIAP